MDWYIAKIVFRINAGGRPQFDEQLRLIRARSAEEAILKARMIGLDEEAQCYAQAVEWEFVNIADIHPLSALADGATVYTQTQEEDNVSDYLQHIHRRAAGLHILHEQNA